MAQDLSLSAPVLEQFLIQARFTKAVASLRLHDEHARLLGDLRVRTFRPGAFIELAGLHPRDQVPPQGTGVTLTVLLGDEVLTLDATLLAPRHRESGTMLRLEWPREHTALHRRRDMRAAGPDQSPLQASVTVGGRCLEARLVNLTEASVGLAFEESLQVDLHERVEIAATLPDGGSLCCPAEVRHLTYLEGQPFPTRLGVVLTPEPGCDLEPVHRFIQARRTDRSHI